MIDKFDSDSRSDYTTISGTWSVAAGKLDTSSTDATIVHDTEPGTKDQKLEWTIKSDAADEYDTFVGVFNYEDSSNYAYVKIRGYLDGATSRIDYELREVIAGSDNLLDSDNGNAGNLWALARLVTVWVDSGHVRSVFLGSRLTGDISDIDAVGSRAGCGTGDVDGTAHFYYLYQWKISDDCWNGQCEACMLDTLPDQMQVTFSGVADLSPSQCVGYDFWNTTTFILDLVAIAGVAGSLTSRQYLLDFLPIECNCGQVLAVLTPSTTSYRFQVYVNPTCAYGSQLFIGHCPVADRTDAVAGTPAIPMKVDCSSFSDVEISMANQGASTADWSSARAFITSI